ncbi:hypothetical protein [Parasphingopyxis sp.]|uniref:hypothetical protein n=1 Tax=Parasphingopyxis sp. TaxID=1920299 RepID=UPI00261DC6AD|nr:hypothetical protein [Parasphingopyxis sp.]
MSVIQPSDPASTGSAAIRAETVRLLSAPQFARAPVMRRLLSYLVDQTLAGNGDRLKAYTIAVDGLGRDADFDAGQDSYPRVQVGRLRKLLDEVYAIPGSRAAMRLHIPKGGYAVHFLGAATNSDSHGEDQGEIAARHRRAMPEWMRMAAVAIAAAILALVAWHMLDGLAGMESAGVETRVL